MVSSVTISKVILTNYEPNLLTKVENAGKEDRDWCEQRNELKTRMSRGQESPRNWQLKDDILYYKNRLYIPNNNELKTEIVKGCHDSHVAEHFGMEKTIEIVTRDFYWN